MKIIKLIFMVIILGAARVSFTQIEGYWDNRFCPCGIDWRAITYPIYENEKFYFGGSPGEGKPAPGRFNLVQGRFLPPPVVWDGKLWGSLGGGVSGGEGSVNQIIADEKNIYIAGNFNKAGETDVFSGMAYWSKSEKAWYPFDIWQSPSSVYKLATDSEYVYACGSIIIRDTVAYVARWNISTKQWEMLRHQFNTSENEHYFLALAVNNHKLYVGGRFSFTEDSENFQTLAGYDLIRKSWFNLDDSVRIELDSDGYGKHFITNIVTGPDSSIYVAGDYTIRNKYDWVPIARSIAKWDGIGWSKILPQNSMWSDPTITSSDGILYVCGSFRIVDENDDTVHTTASWDGTSWKQELKSTSWFQLESGWFTKINGEFYGTGLDNTYSWPMTLFGRWNGKYLAPIDSGSCHGFNWGGVRHAYAEGDSIYAVGEFVYGGGVWLEGIGLWNGKEWSPIGEPINFDPNFDRNTLNAIIKYNGNIYVGGAFRALIGSDTIYGLIKWNGLKWERPFGENAIGGEVQTFTYSADSLFIGGRISYGDQKHALVVLWNKEKLEALGHGLNYDSNDAGQQTFVSRLYYQNGRLYAAGDFDHTPSGTLNRIAFWKDGEWFALGTKDLNGVDDGRHPVYITSLSGRGDTLFISGNFKTIGGVKASGLAMFNGVSISVVDSDIPEESYVTGMDFHEGRVCYTVEATSAYEIPSPNPLFLIGSDFYRLGESSSEDLVLGRGGVSIFPYQKNQMVFAGNTFFAGRSPSYGLAIWHEEPFANVSGDQGISFVVTPNPASSGISISAVSHIHAIAIYDALGRKVIELSGSIDQSHRIDVREFKVGVYYAVIKGDRSHLVYSFIIRR